MCNRRTLLALSTMIHIARSGLKPLCPSQTHALRNKSQYLRSGVLCLLRQFASSSHQGESDALDIPNVDSLPQPLRTFLPRSRAKDIEEPWKVVTPDYTYSQATMHLLRHLSPNHLGPLDYVDLSDAVCYLRNRYSLATAAPSRLVYTRKDIKLPNGSQEHQYLPFPKGTHGFLYYHSPPWLPATCGEIRFRITEQMSASKTSFRYGKDLLLPVGSHWRIPLLSIIDSGPFTVFQEVLVNQKLLSPWLVSQCQTLQRKIWPRKIGPRSRIVHSFKQLFYGETHGLHELVFVVDARRVDTFDFTSALDISGGSTPFPYKGSALWRFERSDLPEHAGRRVVVLRCAKIVEPMQCVVPNYDGLVAEPRETELVTVAGRPWALDVDGPESSLSQSLRRLFIQDHLAEKYKKRAKEKKEAQALEAVKSLESTEVPEVPLSTAEKLSQLSQT